MLLSAHFLPPTGGIFVQCAFLSTIWSLSYMLRNDFYSFIWHIFPWIFYKISIKDSCICSFYKVVFVSPIFLSTFSYVLYHRSFDWITTAIQFNSKSFQFWQFMIWISQNSMHWDSMKPSTWMWEWSPIPCSSEQQEAVY